MLDLSFLSPLVDAIRGHLYGIVAWLVLTAIVNTVFHFATPADVDAWAERNPTVAKVAAFFRKAGFEPVALLVLMKSFFSANPPPPGPIGRTKDEAPVSMKIGSALLFVGALSLLGSQSGCAWATQNEQAIAQDSSRFVLCITGELFAGEKDFGKIAVKCGKSATADVIALITETNAQVGADVGKARASGYVAGVTASARVCEQKP